MHKKRSPSGGIAVIFFLVVAAGYFFLQGPDLSKYEFLKQPRITRMADQRMLVVIAPGDPNAVAKDAFGLLFKIYHKIPGTGKDGKQAPRARWAGDPKEKAAWTGYYALPVPEATVSLPALDAKPGLKAELTTWEYGDVAEILHVGPYAEETPPIVKLHEYIKQQGYEITGYHEEEYLKGPGMFFSGDPATYQTIIRYRVKKKAK
jgi:effector-binding domain-containing protein